ncbi:uncharacterized protein A1O5_07640, partial [Cladophialophora psammophila CBS 110553]
SAEYRDSRTSIEDGSPQYTEANLRPIPSDDLTLLEMSHSFTSAQSGLSSAVEPSGPEYENSLEERGIHSLPYHVCLSLKV